MSKIVIKEEDLTTNLTNGITSTDIVFIPGLMGTNSSGPQPTGEIKIPTLCKTLAQFKANFGDTPRIFGEELDTRAYPKYDSDSKKSGFIKEVIPQITEGTEITYKPMFEVGEPDPGYVMACELLRAGLPVLYYAISVSPVVSNIYEEFITTLFNEENEQNPLLDNEYQFKYLTSGGYPTFEFNFFDSTQGQKEYKNYLMRQMALIAKTRGDAIALIDHTNKADRPLPATNASSVYYSINNTFPWSADEIAADIDTYATMFTPWASYALNGTYPFIKRKGQFPASFGYLIALAKSLKINPNWYAIAGATRGLLSSVASINTDKPLTNAIANSYQVEEKGVCINPITNIKPYGQCIWGNRTLRKYSDERTGYAAAFVNLRGMLCDIKKQVHTAAEALMFEQNNDVLWLNFKGMITPLLDKMLSGNGVESYKIIKIDEESTKTKLAAQISVKMTYAVEEFYIGIQITDDEVTVE